ncbi:MAG TPA: DUF5685 family protein [Eubacteriales bacterium]|nr:DUF5685 family protein [Eubacteriales bacterium]
MFGYIAIDKTKLNEKEIGLYQTFMCGVCLSTKKYFGDYPRNFINYDINFFNVLFHSYLKKDVTIDYAKCVSSPFKKRSMITPDDLTDKIAAANVILNYYNLYDDVVDGGSAKKRTLLALMKKSYVKAGELLPELEKSVRENYESLRQLEKENCDILDKTCHSFANLSRSFCDIILGENTNPVISDLCYNAGKWVYLIDALDDLKKDHKRHNFNPLIASMGNYVNEEQFITDNKEQLTFIFYATLNKIASCYNDLNLTKYVCLLNNVIYEQIRSKTKQTLEKFDREKK